MFRVLCRAKFLCKNSSWSVWLITYGFHPGSYHQFLWRVLFRGQDCDIPDSHSNNSTRTCAPRVWSLSPWEQQHRRHSDLLQPFRNSDRAAKSRKAAEWSWSSPNTDVTGRKKLPDCVKLSDGLTTSTALCLIRSVFFKDVLDKDVTRSFRTVNPSRAGSNYRLHWASRMQQTLTAPFFEGWFFFYFFFKGENKCQDFQAVVLWWGVSKTCEHTFPKPLCWFISMRQGQQHSIRWGCPLPRNHCCFYCEWCLIGFITFSLFAMIQLPVPISSLPETVERNGNIRGLKGF